MSRWPERRWDWDILLWVLGWVASAVVVGLIFRDFRAGLEWMGAVVVALLAYEAGREKGVEQAEEQRRKDDETRKF